jgi:hypothetical protein
VFAAGASHFRQILDCGDGVCGVAALDPAEAGVDTLNVASWVEAAALPNSVSSQKQNNEEAGK